MAHDNRWIGIRLAEGGDLHTVDHRDPSFAYMVYRSQITDIHKLLESIELAWDFAFGKSQADYISHVGIYLEEQKYIDRSSSREHVRYEFDLLSPHTNKSILNQQVLSSVVAAYTSYIKATLSFILPGNIAHYPKTIKIDIKEAASSIDLDDLIVKSCIPEITALGFSDYPSLKRRCVELEIYPNENNRDLKVIERLISKRNRLLHFHPGAEFIKSGKLRQTDLISSREMWSSLRAFSRMVNGIERRAMRKYRIWTGFYMLERFAKSSGKWL